ncbi:NTP transferase domain-containing protein [Alphaproteobacteria bacterium]|nr:NTP transferase domain-containing protein [Alphaproteobacteria bacterium]
MKTLIILAGGLGTRLRAISSDLPKCLVPIGKHPFLNYKLIQAVNWGVSDVVLAVGHMGALVEDYVLKSEDRRLWGDLNITVKHDGDVLKGTGGALRDSALQCQSNTFLVTYGDNLLHISDSDIRTMFCWATEEVVMTVNAASFSNAEPNITLLGTSFAVYEKAPTATYVDYGLFSLNKSIVKKMPSGPFGLSEWLVELSKENPFRCHIVNFPFYEINDPVGLSKTQKFVEQQSEFFNIVPE